jgi:Xaa-Pro aminopeptidase
LTLERVRDWLGFRMLDAAYLTNPVSIAYLTGFRCNPHERLLALVVTSRRAVLVVPGMEEENARVHATGVELASWRDGEDPYALVAEAMEGLRKVALEKDHITLGAAETLRDRLGIDQGADAGRELRRLRRRKTPEELEKHRRAAEVTDAVSEEVFALLRPGLSEAEVAMRIADLVAQAGCTLAFESSVQFGPNSAIPHHKPGGARLKEGDLVLLDFGAAFEGYCADITRTHFCGEPSEEVRAVYDAVLRANRAGVEAVRAGVSAGGVDAAARRVIEEAGYGEAFVHRVGHGLGLEIHEDPSLDPGSTVELEEGMVVTVEPGIYLPGLGGVRIEDDVVVEPSGGRVLTSDERELRAIRS